MPRYEKICGGKNKAVNREQSYEYLKKADGKGCGLHYILKKKRRNYHNKCVYNLNCGVKADVCHNRTAYSVFKLLTYRDSGVKH